MLNLSACLSVHPRWRCAFHLVWLSCTSNCSIGYVFGNPANWPFDDWINQSPNVVIVSVYYRLDSFGFLAHPAFASSSEFGDLNVGFQDQTEALRWVQKHIDAFGGDPNQVTINGQSAGASSVELHLVAPQQAGLFHGAIAQSVYRTPLPSPQQQEVSSLMSDMSIRVRVQFHAF